MLEWDSSFILVLIGADTWAEPFVDVFEGLESGKIDSYCEDL